MAYLLNNVLRLTIDFSFTTTDDEATLTADCVSGFMDRERRLSFVLLVRLQNR